MHPPAFSLPTPPDALTRLVARLPSRPPSMAFSLAANRLAWKTLRELDWSLAEGKRFAIHLHDLGARVHFTVRQDGFHAVPGEGADVTFTATAADFARLALRLEDPDTLFFNRRLIIEGDTNLGLMVKNMLDGIEIETLAANLPLGLGRLMLGWRSRLLAGG